MTLNGKIDKHRDKPRSEQLSEVGKERKNLPTSDNEEGGLHVVLVEDLEQEWSERRGSVVVADSPGELRRRADRSRESTRRFRLLAPQLRSTHLIRTSRDIRISHASSTGPPASSRIGCSFRRGIASSGGLVQVGNR